MESPGQTFDRLLKALDDLVAEEAAMIQAADHGAVAEIQQRAEPVITALAALAPAVADAGAQARVGALLERRQRNIDLLGTQLAEARGELDSLQQSERRAARIAPIYGRAEGGSGPTQLRTSG